MRYTDPKSRPGYHSKATGQFVRTTEHKPVPARPRELVDLVRDSGNKKEPPDGRDA